MSGKSKIICIRKCTVCGKDVEIRHKDRVVRENVFCSKKCEGEFRKIKTTNCICPVCGKEFYLKKSAIEKCDNNYCSIDCHKIDKKRYMAGYKNHQYGLLGKLNPTWKSDERITTYGYKKIRCLDHPFRDIDGFVLEHRLVAERYLLEDEYSVEICGIKYLSPYVEVHHIDEDKLNNNPDNLMIMTPEEHMSLHKSK